MRSNLNSKTCMVFGQDKSTHLLHSLKNYHWSFEGHVEQRNKTERLVLMVSLLMSREFGWNFGFTDDELKKVLEAVSKKRKNSNHLNTKLVIVVSGTENKSYFKAILSIVTSSMTRSGWATGIETTCLRDLKTALTSSAQCFLVIKTNLRMI